MTGEMAAGYLAAMIDGEGTVYLRLNKKVNRWLGTQRAVSIANTERSIIDGCIECCELLQIPYTLTINRGNEGQGYQRLWSLNFNNRRAFAALVDLPLCSQKKRERLQLLASSYKHPQMDTEEARRLYWDEGLTLGAVGERFGVTYHRIQALFRRHGIPTRRAIHGTDRQDGEV